MLQKALMTVLFSWLRLKLSRILNICNSWESDLHLYGVSDYKWYQEYDPEVVACIQNYNIKDQALMFWKIDGTVTGS
jgi:hypothetical protein